MYIVVPECARNRDDEAWELADIERGLAEAKDPNTVWHDQEDLVKGRWRAQREPLLARIAARDAADAARGRACRIAKAIWHYFSSSG